MLDVDTRRRIDTARDILVGKVPDPKSQVEQITIALIYKFMDDMDAEAEELGGSRKFFAGDFARYGWAKLMRSGLGGFETLNLYADAITKMPENPGIPRLFRDIFKNAYLPYRDPQTLRAFLKIIDEFEYDHSERLGDAFEFLLSVLGSQGDAGQFRTPRHIIDFMVAIVNPKKDEKVLDPACGTAGFLISSYKHILKANTHAEGYSTLTPDEKGGLAANFKGYDISPDMVRLSLVNMYLHGFMDPHIFEYDTLTSQERWNEYADVILANPPFMSPTGGIKPHNRFSVQSKRSEVLFVDYIAEHLTPSGRAGIIVPEGVIFQGQTAYTQLRKTLVEDYLVAVISLPQGVFNPYSGVKTSILILDKLRAKRSSHILFVRIDDDGFDLGTTRKRTGEGDLPETRRLLAEWFAAADNPDPRRDFRGTDRTLLVSRQEIAASGNYRLTADTYRKIENKMNSGVSWVPLNDLLGPRVNNRVGEDLTVPILSITMKRGLVDQSDKFKKRIASADISGYKRVARNELVVGFPIDEGVLGIQTLYPFAAVSPAYDVWTVDSDKIDLSFFELILRSEEARRRYRLKMRGTAGRRRVLDKTEFLKIEIPLPSMEVQREVVAQVEGYQKIVDGARTVLDNYRPQISVQPDWPRRPLRDLAENLDSRRVPITKEDRRPGPFPYYGASGIVDHVAEFLFDEDLLLVSEDGANLLARSTPIAFSVTGKCWVNNHAHVLKFENRATQKFVEFYLNSISIEEFVTGAAQPKLNQQALNNIPIPLPDEISVRHRIVEDIEVEQGLVAANRELIAHFEKKIQVTLARVWGEGATTESG